MRIGVLAPGMRQVPGGGKSIFPTGFLAVKIADELVKRGHFVDVYASSDSQTDGNLRSFGLSSQFNENLRVEDPKYYLELVFKFTLFMASQIVKESQKYDIIHAHDFRQLMYLSHFSKCPIVYTYHGTPEDDILDDVDKKRNETFYQENNFVAISQKQAQLSKKYFKIIDVVYNGIEVEKVPFEEKPDDKILFVGRLIRKKNPAMAIKVARKLDKRIELIGTKHPPKDDLVYFEKEVLPLTKNKKVNLVGFIPYPDIYKEYSRAKVFLLPIDWDEPFGMVMIESMAAGTPVIAFNRGSVTELIKDHETGFICPPNDSECMTQRVKQIYDMPEDEYIKMRRKCRKHVEDNFTIEKMIDSYEKIYEKIIRDWKAKHGS